MPEEVHLKLGNGTPEEKRDKSMAPFVREGIQENHSQGDDQ
jgi:hypothetical protein